MKKEVTLLLLVILVGISLMSGIVSAVTQTLITDSTYTKANPSQSINFNNQMNSTSFNVKWKSNVACVSSVCSGLCLDLSSPNSPSVIRNCWGFIDTSLNTQTLSWSPPLSSSEIYNSVSVSLVAYSGGALLSTIPTGYDPSVTVSYLNVTGTALICPACGTYPNCVTCGAGACTSWTYSEWGVCTNGQQTRTATGNVAGCTGTPTESLTRACDQTMFTMYQNTNSHVAIWNTSDYPLNISYNNIFDGKIYTGSNPHVCNAGNTNAILWLNAINNSHVSNVQIAGYYDIPVCYGDLICSISSSACSGDYRNVSRLYQKNNTHISNLSDTNYPWFLCCKSVSSLTTPQTFFWKNMNGGGNINGIEINTAEIHDSVLLDFGNSGTSVAYSIMNAATGTEVISGNTNKGFIVWKVDTAGIYSFNITNSTGSFHSSNITVSSSEVDTAPSDVRILSPVDRSTYKVGSPISFNQTTSDEDDLLNLIWDLGNTSKNTIVNYSLFERNFRSNNFGDFITNYSSPGVYNIELLADEASRDKFGSNSTSVIVLNTGINVVPIITTPKRGITLPSKTVVFNASETYVVNCTTCSSPSSCQGFRANGFYTTDTLLNCTYIHAPSSYRGLNLPSNYNLTFTWTLDDGTIFTNKWTSKTYFSIVEFIYNFQEARKHMVQLEVTYS